MSIVNTLMLTILISFATYDSIQGEIMFGTNIPKVNVTRLVGRWNLLASKASEDQSMCKYIDVEQQSEKGFTMKLTMFDRPTGKNNGIIPKVGLREVVLTATKNNDSETFAIKNGDLPGTHNLAIFDVVYDSYMAFYMGWDMAGTDKYSHGYVLIFGRNTTLPDGVLERVQNSSLQQNDNLGNRFRTIDYSLCV